MVEKRKEGLNEIHRAVFKLYFARSSLMHMHSHLPCLVSAAPVGLYRHTPPCLVWDDLGGKVETVDAFPKLLGGDQFSERVGKV